MRKVYLIIVVLIISLTTGWAENNKILIPLTWKTKEDSLKICEIKREAYNRLFEGKGVNNNCQNIISFNQAKGWNISILDSAIGTIVNGTSLALDSAGNPHIAYEKHGVKIIYTYYNSGSSKWVSDPILGGEHPSLALDSLDYPHISCWYNGLRYLVKSDSGWDTTEVYSGAWVDWTSIALDKKGNPHIGWLGNLYVKDMILYSYWDDTSWVTEEVDTMPAEIGIISLALDNADCPHLSYGSNTFVGIKYAEKTTGIWKIDTIKTYSCWDNSIKIDTSGKPCVVHRGYNLMYAIKETSGWTIDTIGLQGREASLFIDKNNNSHISYLSETGDLFWLTYVYKDSNNIWHSEQLDSFTMTTPNISYTSIAVDNGGYAHISYRGIVNRGGTGYGGLKYATGHPTGIEEQSNCQKDGGKTVKAFPNPFTQQTAIQKEGVGGWGLGIGKEKIRIYNVSGKLVEKTNNPIIGKNLKTGIYFVKIGDYKPIKITKIK